MKVRIRCKRKEGIWRAGVFHPGEWVEHETKRFTEDQGELLLAEPLLEIEPVVVSEEEVEQLCQAAERGDLGPVLQPASLPSGDLPISAVVEGMAEALGAPASVAGAAGPESAELPAEPDPSAPSEAPAEAPAVAEGEGWAAHAEEAPAPDAEPAPKPKKARK